MVICRHSEAPLAQADAQVDAHTHAQTRIASTTSVDDIVRRESANFTNFPSINQTDVRSTVIIVASPSNRTFLALGVLSRPTAFARRSLVRSTWGSSPLIHQTSAVRLRFVLAPSSVPDTSLAAEHAAHADLHIAVGTSDGPWYTAKALHWLRRGCSDALFCATADDDAYVVLVQVVADLRAVAAAGLGATAVYAAFEWFAYHRNTGQYDAWGPALTSTRETENRWRRLSGVPHTAWPGERVPHATRRSCSKYSARTCRRYRHLCKQCWRGCPMPRAHATASMAQLSSSTARASGLSSPFPLAKGTLVVWGREIVASLVDEGAEAASEIEHAAAVAAAATPPTTILHDVFMSWLLARMRGERGSSAAGVALVDIGIEGREALPQQGFAEFKGNLTARRRRAPGADTAHTPEPADPASQHQRYPPGMRVAHVGRGPLLRFGRRRWPHRRRLWPNATLETRLLRESLSVLHATFGGAAGSGARRILRCAPHDWYNQSRCVVTTGEDWIVCRVEERVR